MPEELLPSEAAKRIGATTRSVQRWIATGRLPARRVGGRWRVAIDALVAFNRTTTSADRAEAGTSPIRTVFVANRGEIAARIRRTADRLGIRAVVPPTEGPGALDLLDAEAVVAAARGAGADAVHPGFGFLAENADFAAAVEAAGIRWVGPPADAIRAMGDKAAARRLAASLGVPIVPGYDEPDQSDAALTAAAARIGYPLLVKPAAGGGGKGMRTVRDSAGLDDAIASARREAKAAFGDDRLVLERLLEGPRHVEIQVLFDRHGAGVHLGERDCSIQRRHQKILEEAPSPAVDDATRARMGAAALELARAVGYESAGTCEFLLDERGRFHFLEMNTRLQVEHPVTEMVTGRDLVADQLRIADGEPLGFRQQDVTRAGHAVEVRLYAEDAEAGFLPATGRVEALRWPSGEGVRVDAGIDVGTVVGGRFDPMLAKIVAHGTDRTAALDRLAAALDDTLVLGLTTNLRFLRWLVREPAVRDGQARVDTLERIWPPDDWTRRAAVPDRAWQAAARRLAATTTDPWTGGWRLNARPVVRIATDDAERSVSLGDATGATGATGDAPDSVVVGDTVHLDVGGRSVAFRLAPPPDVDRAARAAQAHAHGGGPVDLLAPMPGAVLAIHRQVGDSVEAGDPIVTLEAMKMEHVVPAPGPGRVSGIAVSRADQVTRNQVLATIEP
ncbi:MAG TPA: biotin carboxylase N-terminal domain-containing protein [Candidatus Limnocylindrales bacterium]